MKNDILVEDAISLIEQNFYFLTIGEFFSNLSKQHPLKIPHNQTIKKKFDGFEYNFNASIVNELLKENFNSKEDEITLFEYFIEMNAVRGICMAMIEALRFKNEFQKFIESKLGFQYEDFIDIVSFVRNVLSHNIHADMYLNEYDFQGTLQKIIRKKRDPNISFEFNYHNMLKEIQSPSKQYGLYLDINFSNLKENMPFNQIISPLKLILLAELCYNLTISFQLSKTKYIDKSY